MKSLKERKDQIEGFYEVDEGAREKLLEEIRAYAKVQGQESFIAEVRASYKFELFSGIGVIYEALSEDPKPWSNFFKEEYERAFELATESDSAFEILGCLEEICFVEEEKIDSREEIIRLLEGYLNHEKEAIRYKAIWHLGDWIAEDNINQYDPIIQSVISKLGDANWKVKYIAHSTLKDWNRLPQDFKFTFIEKMKIKFLSPFSM